VNKKALRKFVSAILIASMLLSSFSIAYGATAQATSDIKGHWAEDQITAWMDKGLIKGYEDGSFKPSNKITRAEFFALINRSFGFTESAAITFSDVASDNWAYSEVAKAVKAGYISGYSDGTIGASKPISRQEAAAIVDRLLGESDVESTATTYSDSAAIALWAKDSVEAIVAKGIMSGYAQDNSFKPTESITRAEAVVTLDRAIASQVVAYNKAGTYGPATGVETINNNVAILVTGVTLQNMIINGDLLLGEGIGEGDAFLENVKVTGTVTVQGGGENSIHFNNSVLVDIIIDKKTGTGIVRITSEGSTTVALVVVNSPVRIEEIRSTGAGFGNVNLSAKLPSGSRVTLLGSFETVNMSSQQIIVDVPEGTIKKFNANAGSTGTTLDLSSGATINELILNAIIKVIGKGAILVATIHTPGSTFENPPGTPGGGSSGSGGSTGPTVPTTPVDPTLPADTTPPTVVSANFIEDHTKNILVIVFSEPVKADISNFIPVSITEYYWDNFKIDSVSGSGTNTITLIFSQFGGDYGYNDYLSNGGITGVISISSVTDLAGNIMVPVQGQAITRYDLTPPTVNRLGTGEEVFQILPGAPAILLFSEELSEDSQDNVEATLSANASGNLTYRWDYLRDLPMDYTSRELTISADQPVTFINDVIMNIEDRYGNIGKNVQLIKTSGNIAPTIMGATFTSATTLQLTFSEPVTVTDVTYDFTPGEVYHVVNTAVASSFVVTAVEGLESSVLTLTVAGTLEGMPALLSGGDTAVMDIGAGVTDLLGTPLSPVLAQPIARFDHTGPNMVSVEFTSATEFVATFTEPVLASLSNFETTNTLTSMLDVSENSYEITGISGSGTNIITFTVRGVNGYTISPNDVANLEILNGDVTDMALNRYTGNWQLTVKRLDRTPITVTTWGDRTQSYTISAGDSGVVTLTFSKPIANRLKNNIEYALTQSFGQATGFTFSWEEHMELKISSTNDITLIDRAYVEFYGVGDDYRTALVLIDSKDIQAPTKNDYIYFNLSDNQAKIYLIFSEPVYATLSDFTPGEITNNSGMGTATGYRITGIIGSGTERIVLSVEGIGGVLHVNDSAKITIGAGLTDASHNPYANADSEEFVNSYYGPQ
jgi:hypothetical protein